MLLSVVERCPLKMSSVVILYFGKKNICTLFGGVSCIEVSVNGDSIVSS